MNTNASEIEQVAMEAAALPDAPRQGGTANSVPSRILIVPWGDVKSTAGTFVVDDEAALATIAAFRAHGTDLPVDYEHQTLGGPYSSPTGLAPAAGWVKALTAVPPTAAEDGVAPGIWAEVEWTPEAMEKLRGKQYRYLSPVALVRREDRRIVGLHSVALTNKPAIVGATPVVNSGVTTENTESTEKEELTVRTVGAGGSAVLDDEDEAAVELRRLLSLDESATQDVLLVMAAKRIDSLQRADALRQATQQVDAAMAAGKLVHSQREWALALAQRDPAEFDRWEAGAPQVVPLGRSVLPIRDRGDRLALRRGIEQAARAEWQVNRAFLEKLCSEEAFVAAALRE